MLVVLLVACLDDSSTTPPRVAATASRLPWTWVVDCAGGGDFLSIQDGIAAASSGDVVEVHACTYFGAIDFQGKTLRVEATAGPAATTLLAVPGSAAVKVKGGEGPGTALVGFTISGGGGIEDGVVDIEMSALLIEDCVITGGTGAYGLHSRSSHLVVRNSTVAGNAASSGWAVYAQRGGILLTGSTISCDGAAVGLHPTHGQFLVDRSTIDCTGGEAFRNEHAIGRIERSVLHGLAIHEGEAGNDDTSYFEDTVLDGGVVGDTGPIIVRNCIVTGGGITLDDADASTIEGTVIRDAPCGLDGQDSETTIRNNAWFGLTTDLCSGGSPVGLFGNIAADCQHTDPAAGDWTLQPGSPCIDAGPADPDYADVDGSPNDIGVYGGPFSQGGGW
jgi:hypothetical protein